MFTAKQGVVPTVAITPHGKLVLEILEDGAAGGEADPADLENVFDACFNETTTIGLRYQVLRRRKLSRAGRTVEAGGRRVRVKITERPGKTTAKVEADDLLNVIGGRAERGQLRQEAEQVVLRKERK